MKTKYEQVKEFHEAFGHPVREIPKYISGNELELRSGLHCEEAYTELLIAVDIVDQFDSILDSLYVIYGSAMYMGISEASLVEGFKAVHESNMSKLWTMKEIKACKDEITWCKVAGTNKYHVKSVFGKTLKPPSWSKDKLTKKLQKIINDQFKH